MWTRAELKKEARNVLKSCYWSALLVTVITSVVDNVYKVTSVVFEDMPVIRGKTLAMAALADLNFAELMAIIGVMMLTAFAGSIITVFVAGPISVGEKRYFLEGTQYRFDINNILHGFTCGKYLNVVFTNLLVNIFTALWTLLFIIPGIIKGYAYAMTPYILAENPNIKPMQAINLSCRMTKGHKLELFVLGLSFIGWYMLGALAFGIGTAFVVPYDRATHAQFYLALRSEALNKGTVTLQELEYGL
ncbi:MAG: DUF975 family protein [Oscillospiraceae bacterium]|nr:DUF975 family protein [Oscillospiraceae bacterium]